MGFSSDIFKVATSDGRNFTLLESVSYLANNGITYIMPTGATSDGASTPQEVWDVIPPFGTYWKAAFLHDCAYRNTLLINGTKAALNKQDCDNLLREALDVSGVNFADTEAIYNAVCIFGKSSFESDRK